MNMYSSIKELQTLLNRAGANPVLKVDGKLGAKTTQEIKDYQKARGLKADGIVGELTWNHLMFEKYPNFKRSEFECNCGHKYCNGFPVLIDENLVALMQRIRNHFGKSITITSAVRCKEWNRIQKGSPTSQHLYGKACDFKVSGVLPSTVYSYCNSINLLGGVGKYRTFTHVDVRGVKARWNYS